MIIYLIAVGFISILGQVVILRELNVAFFGIELIYIIALGFWLIGTAIGASTSRHSPIPKEKNIQIIFCLTAILLLADFIFIRWIRIIFGGVPGGYLPFLTQMAGLIISLIPISFLTGLLFQWTTKRFTLENGTLAKAYAIESFGGVIGGLSSTLFLYFGVQNFSIALICCLFSFGVIVFYSWKEKSGKLKYFFTAALFIVFALLGISGNIDRWMTSWNHPNLLKSNDTPYSRVTVTSLENQIVVFQDDALSYETEGIAAEEFVQMSTLQASKFENILVLGGGFEGIILELLKLPVKKIDYVEINKNLIQTIYKHLPVELQSSLNDKRVNIVYEDPRQYLNLENSYDIILVGMPEPTSAQSNRFYTKEFFELCSKRISGNGILAFRIRSAENLWTTQLQNRNRSIYNAVKSVFSNVIVLPGVTNIFIASQSNLSTNPQVLIERFNERLLQTKLVSPQYINYIYTNDRFEGIKKILSAGTAIPNSDLRPACYNYTTSIWLSKFFTDFSMPDVNQLQIKNVFGSAIFWILLTVILLVVFIKKLKPVRRFILAALSGFVGMVLETILLLNYQSKCGILYQNIGIMLMTFMIGLSIGAYLINRFFVTAKSQKKYPWLAIALILGFAFLTVTIYYLIKIGSLNHLFITSAFLIFTGFFVSSIFAFVSLWKLENRQKIMIHLYSADLLGGSLGSIAASLFLIPVYGILVTSIIMTVTVLIAFLFLF